LNWIDRRVDEAFDDTERSRSRECNCASSRDPSKFCGFGVQTPQRITPGKFELQLLRQKEAARNCKELEQVLLESDPNRDVRLRTPATTLRVAKVLHATGTIQVRTNVLELSHILALLEQIEQDRDSARKKLTEQKASISKNLEAVVLLANSNQHAPGRKALVAGDRLEKIIYGQVNRWIGDFVYAIYEKYRLARTGEFAKQSGNIFRHTEHMRMGRPSLRVNSGVFQDEQRSMTATLFGDLFKKSGPVPGSPSI
jgi:hypothetical protein